MNDTPPIRYTPGDICPETAQWQIFAPDGHATGAERQVDKGEPFPPAAKGEGWTYGEPDTSRGGRPDAPASPASPASPADEGSP